MPITYWYPYNMIFRVLKANEQYIFSTLVFLNIMSYFHCYNLNYTAFLFWFSDCSNTKIQNMHQNSYSIAKILHAAYFCLFNFNSAQNRQAQIKVLNSTKISKLIICYNFPFCAHHDSAYFEPEEETIIKYIKLQQQLLISIVLFDDSSHSLFSKILSNHYESKINITCNIFTYDKICIISI